MPRMYLIDTNIISELRKGRRANPGVRAFFDELEESGISVYLSVVTLGELQRGVDLIRHRGDHAQAEHLQNWLNLLLDEYADEWLEFGLQEARIWGRLRVPHPENALDKQIAATALSHGLTLVTRNHTDFDGLGLDILNPFT